MEKSKIFDTELSYISDDFVRESTKILLNMLPDYFYTMPASTSGLHHPDFALGEGGLVRHTKAAVRIAIELFNDSVFNTFEFKEHTKDLIIMALILHDGFKQGKEEIGHTSFEHPLLAAHFIYKNIDKLPMEKDDVLQVMRLIKSHMGPWNTSKNGEIKLPIPKLDDEKFVHACDYLASRDFLEITFINNEIVSKKGKKKVLKNNIGGNYA